MKKTNILVIVSGLLAIFGLIAGIGLVQPNDELTWLVVTSISAPSISVIILLLVATVLNGKLGQPMSAQQLTEKEVFVSCAVPDSIVQVQTETGKRQFLVYMENMEIGKKFMIIDGKIILVQ